MSDKARLIEILRERSVKTGEFTLSSGAKSDFYVDARVTTLHAEGAGVVARLMLTRLHPDAVAIGGMSLGADPIACSTAAISGTTSRPVHAFLIRKTPKGHGTGRDLEGLANLPDGAKVCMVEDTTTTGGSLLKAIKRAEAHGLQVVQCVTVVDREEGAVERLQEAGYVLEALTTRTELIG